MFAVIVGGGKVGSYLAESLESDGHRVAVVEKNPDTCAKVQKRIGGPLVCGDGGDLENLEKAGCRKADLVAAVTGADEVNLVICQLAKFTFDVRRVIARINNPRNEWLFHKDWGVDVGVSAVHIISRVIQEEARLGDLVTLLKLRKGEMALVEGTLSQDSRAAGKQVSELNLPSECVLAAIIRGDQLVIPRGTTTLEAGDEVLAITTVAAERTLDDILTPK